MNLNTQNIKESCILYACNSEDLYKDVKIFNLDTFGPILHVKLSMNTYTDFRLMQIINFDNSEAVGTYEYDECQNPWVDIPIDVLDLSIGLHTYRLEFINVITGDTFYQYFIYTIQSDNPEQPYIYMSR